MVLNGGQKIAMNMIGTTLTVQTLLVTNMSQKWCASPTAVLAPFLLTGWEFLRMLSECTPLEWAHMKSSAVCIINKERKSKLVIRWRRRMQRPPGSLLQRPCKCTSTEQSPWCVVHRLAGGVEALGLKPENDCGKPALESYSRRRRRCRCSRGASCSSATRTSIPVRGSR